MQFNKLTFTTTSLIAIGTIFASVFVSYYSTQSSITDRINTISAQSFEQISEDRQRISKVEEAITTIKSDTAEIKSDIKEILRNSR